MAEGQANPTSSVGSGSPSTINLQFLSPSVQEVPGGRLNLPNVPLDIEIEALQRRISERLHSAPSPDRLRLIFYGRAMTDAKAKLRTYLNREFDRPDPPETITIHLVISPSDTQSTSSTPYGLPNPPTGQAQPPSRVSVFGQQPANLPPHTQIHAGFPGSLGQGNPQPPMFQSAHMNLHQQALQGQLLAIQQQLRESLGNPHGMAMPNFPFPPPLPGMQQQHMANWPNFGGQPQPFGNGHHNTQESGENRPSGQHTPHTPHSQTNVQDMIGPNGQRMRVTTHVESMVISRSGTPQPPSSNGHHHASDGSNRTESRPAGQGHPPAATAPASHPVPATALPRNGFAFPSMPPSMPWFQAPPQFRPTGAAPPMSNTTTAWLVSSPAGPQAVLFSPEHGFFSSRAQPAPAPTPTQARTTQVNSTGQQPTGGLRRLQEQVDHIRQQEQNIGQREGQVQGDAAGQAAPVIIRRRVELQPNQDMIALFFSRIWLFIRLYLFALMFTETGSWLRYAILTGAVIYCLTPPNTFLQEQFRRLQRHLDGLVPLAPPVGARDARPGGREQPPDQHNQPRGAASARTRREITPQEAAQRLLQQHNERHRSWWVETGRRIERSIALFLASLVPGVGERHIRARNEAEAAAREAAEREERERQEQQEARLQNEAQAGGAGGETSTTATQEATADNTGDEAHANNARDNTAPQPPLVQV